MKTKQFILLTSCALLVVFTTITCSKGNQNGGGTIGVTQSAVFDDGYAINRLNGKVKKMSEYQDPREIISEYNEKGFITKKSLKVFGKLSETTSYKYDSQNRLIESVQVSENGKFQESYTLTYGSHNKYVPITLDLENILFVKGAIKLEYKNEDAAENVIADMLPTSNNELTYNIKARKGGMLDILLGALNIDATLSYNGALPEKIVFDGGGNTATAILKSTANGVISSIDFNIPSVKYSYSIVFEPHPKWLLLKTVTEKEGGKINKEEYKYDDKYSLIQDNYTKYRYEYDSKNNWVKQFTIEESKADESSEYLRATRTYEYY